MAGEIATGYISIIPETSQIKPLIKEALGESEAPAKKSGANMGNKLIGGMSKTLKIGAVAAGGAVAGILGTSVAKGFKRLDALDQAQAKMRGLGYEAKEVTSLMDSVSKSVKGTAFGLDEAAGSAAKLGAVGVEVGKDMDRAMTLTADIAAQAGTNMDDISSIMAKVAGAGKVTGETLAQLDDRATGAGAAIADHLGVSIEEMRKQVSDGKVDFETFQTAMEEHLGGAAQKTGETFKGAFDNMMSATGRLGQKLLDPVFTAAPGLFGSVGKSFDAIGEAIAPASEKIGQALTPAMEKLGGLLETKMAPALGDAAGAFGEFLANLITDGLESDIWSNIGDAIGKIADAAKQAWPTVSSLATSFGQASATLSVATWQALADVLNALAPVITNVVAPALEEFAAAASEHPGLAQALITGWLGMNAIGKVAGPVGSTVKTLTNLGGAAKFATDAAKGGGGLSGIFSRLAEGAKSANPMIAKMGGAAAKTSTGVGKFGSVMSKVLGPLGKLSKLFMTGIRFINPWVGAATLAAGALTFFFTKTETGKKAWAGLVDGFKSAADWVKGVFVPMWDNIKSAMEPVVDFFGKVKDAVGEVFSAFTGGGGGHAALENLFGTDGAVTILSTVEKVRDGFDLLKEKAGEAFGWAKGKWDEFIKGIGQFHDTWVKPVLDFVDTVKSAFGEMFDVFRGRDSSADALGSLIGSDNAEMVMGVLDSVKSAIGTLKETAGQAWDWMKSAWDSLSAAMQPVGEAIKAGFSAIGSVISKIWSGVISVVWETMKSGAKLLGAVLSSAWDGVKLAFTVLGNIIKSVWENLIKPVFTLLRNIVGLLADILTGNFENIGHRFADMGDNIRRIVVGVINVAFDVLKGALRLVEAAWNKMKETVGKVVSAVRSKVDEMVGVIKKVPGKIKSAFTGAGTWLLEAGKKIIQGLIDGIKSMGNAVGNAIKSVVPDWVPGIGNATGSIVMVSGGITESYASGGVRGRLPRQATIERPHGVRGLVQWAEASTGGELFTPLNGLRRRSPRSMAIMAKGADIAGAAIVDKKTGQPLGASYGKSLGPQAVGMHSFANGGIVESMVSWAKRKHPGLQVTSTYRNTPDHHGAGKAVDFSNGYDTTPQMQAMARDIYKNFRDQTLELIHWPLNGWQNLKNMAPLNYGEPTNSQHRNHVHWAIAAPLKENQRSSDTTTTNAATWGPPYFVGEIVRKAKDMALDALAAKIGVATALVESGNPLRMFANKRVPESLKYRHDALGSDHDSVGLFQQRDNGAWGTVKQRMTPYDSAGMFFNKLKSFDYKSMDPGAAAQKVQVSAFPGRYATQMATAQALIDKYGHSTTGAISDTTGTTDSAPGSQVSSGKSIEWGEASQVFSEVQKKRRWREQLARWRKGAFDSGGIAQGKGFLLKDTVKPERVLNPTNTKSFDKLPPVLADVANKLGMSAAAQRMAAQATNNIAAAVKSFTASDALAYGERLGFGEFTGLFKGSVGAYEEMERSFVAQVDAADGLKQAEKNLAEARAEYAAAMSDSTELTVKQQRKLDDALKAVEDAKKPNKKGEVNADKVAKAELKLARVREDIAAEQEKAGAKQSDTAMQAAENLLKAEADLADARETVAQVAAAAGHAEIALAIEVADMVLKLVDKVIGAVMQARSQVAQAMASMMQSVSELVSMTDALRDQVSVLGVEAAAAKLQVMDSLRGIRLAQFDGVRAQLEAAKTVADIEKKFAAQRKADARAAMSNYRDLSLTLDRWRWSLRNGIDSALDDMAEWSDESRALFAELQAAQIGRQIAEKQAQINVLKATFQHQRAVHDLVSATTSLGIVAEKLAVMSGKAFGYDSVEATIGTRYTNLLAEKAKLQADNANIGTWINPVNWFTSMPAASKRIKQIDQELAQLAAMDEFKQFSPEQLAEVKRIQASAGVMGFFGAGDKVAEMIKNSSLGDAARALDRARFEQSLIDARHANELAKQELDRKQAEVDQAQALFPLETLLAQLTAKQDSEKTWAEYWRETDPGVREALASLAAFQADSSATLGQAAKTPAVMNINMPANKTSYSAEEVQELIDQMNKAQSELDIRVQKLEKPSASASDVVAGKKVVSGG